MTFKEVIKKLPGIKKLVFFFNEVRKLNAQVEALEIHTQLLSEAQDNLKAALLNAYQKENSDRPKLAIYTILTGDYDKLRTPLVVEPGCDYYCVTNNPNLKSNFWKILLIENEEGLDNIRMQRKLKLSPHKLFPEYEHSLYIDAAIVIRGSVFEWIDRYSTGKPLLTFRHPERDCIYDEAEACKQLKKDSNILIDKQMERYRDEGYPEKNGLIWSAVIYRKHNDPSVIAVDEKWLEELSNNSRRDQLSFNYVCWKNGFQYDECAEDYHDSFLWAYMHDGLPR